VNGRPGGPSLPERGPHVSNGWKKEDDNFQTLEIGLPRKTQKITKRNEVERDLRARF
jgi:hypothetical protein